MSTHWRRVLIEVVSSTTSCQRCSALVPSGDYIAMVQLHPATSQVEPWCRRCFCLEIYDCSEIMLRK
jgi:hypothetical protein